VSPATLRAGRRRRRRRLATCSPSEGCVGRRRHQARREPGHFRRPPEADCPTTAHRSSCAGCRSWMMTSSPRRMRRRHQAGVSRCNHRYAYGPHHHHHHYNLLTEHSSRIRRPVLDGPEDKPEIEMVQNRPSNPTHSSTIQQQL